ncbi:MAG TPA: uL1 family ribosomal protein [Candidatus Azoamicus sp.]
MIIENRLYDINEALSNLKLNKKSKFIENIEVSVNLSFLPKNKNFVVKGYSILPHGELKKFKLAVFISENNLILSSDSSIKILTESDLISLKKKDLLFDLIITTPSSMIKFGKLSKILNSKNLMPDVKYGTITTDVKSTLELLKKHYIRFKK